MNANFIIFAPMEENFTSGNESDDEIKRVADRYLNARNRAEKFREEAAQQGLLTGSPGTINLKRLGHRALSTDDFANIVEKFGTDDDRKSYAEFSRAQELLSKRLSGVSQIISVILKQAKMSYVQYYDRQSSPHLWKAEQMVAILEVIKRLQI